MKLRELVVLLTLRCVNGAYFSDHPELTVSDDVITEGESVQVTCTLPFIYTGTCRLFRQHEKKSFQKKPFAETPAAPYICNFLLTSQQLLGEESAGAAVSVRCDYVLDGYRSHSSKKRTVIVWARRPSPSLSVSRHLLTLNDSVEVACSPRDARGYRCEFRSNEAVVSERSCRTTLTSNQLLPDQAPSVLGVVNLSCSFTLSNEMYTRSDPSLTRTLLILDLSRASSVVRKVWSVLSSNISLSVTTDALTRTLARDQIPDQSLTAVPTSK